jgi:hypothetical protein
MTRSFAATTHDALVPVCGVMPTPVVVMVRTPPGVSVAENVHSEPHARPRVIAACALPEGCTTGVPPKMATLSAADCPRLLPSGLSLLKKSTDMFVAP